MVRKTTDKKSFNIPAESKSFWGHVEDMRGMLIRSALYLFVFAIIAFLLKDFIFNNIVLSPKESSFITNRFLCEIGKLLNIKTLCLETKPLNIININLSGQFMMHLYISFMSALVFASPFIIMEIWKFIRPALYPNEQSKVRGAVFACVLLFFTGVLFSYFIIVPLTINFFASYSVSESVTNQITLHSYVKTIFSLVVSAGAVFELPIFIFFLAKVGLVTPSFLRKNRKYTLVIILILSAIITPPDIFSQLLISLPLLLLYEISIYVSKFVVSKSSID